MFNMVVFWVLQPGFFIRGFSAAGILFYPWVGMFGVFVVAQLWAFAADLYTDEEGQRLIPVVAVGATAGAAWGSWMTDKFVSSGIIPTEYLLLLALVPLACSIHLTRLVDHRGARGEPVPPASKPQEDPGPGESPLGVVFRSRFLLAVALVTLLLSWVNTNGENLLFRVVQDTLAEQARAHGIVDDGEILRLTRDGTTAFYGNFFMQVNVLALLLQAFVAPRLLKYGRFPAVFLMLPVVVLLSSTAMAVVPVLLVVKTLKIAENAMDYSINNTARHVLWLPVPPGVKYKGKPAVDSLFVRGGDGLAALTALLGVHVLAWETASYFAFNVALVLLWLVLAVVVIRDHGRLSGERSRGSDREKRKVRIAVAPTVIAPLAAASSPGRLRAASP
jgi:AAA family ATP:ADP antiporter